MIRAAAVLILALAAPAQAVTLYVSNEEANVVQLSDRASGKVSGQLPSRPHPETFAVAADGARLVEDRP